MYEDVLLIMLKTLQKQQTTTHVSNSRHRIYISVSLANVFSLVLTALTCPHPGILTLTLTNPIWVTKTRLVLQYNADPTSKQYKGMIDALVKIYRHEGVSGLYKVLLYSHVGVVLPGAPERHSTNVFVEMEYLQLA